MRCPYCYGDGGGYGGGGAMSEETAFRAVDWLIGQAGDGKEIWISFFGGEPLLNFALMEKVVAYAREKVGASQEARVRHDHEPEPARRAHPRFYCGQQNESLGQL